MAQWKFGDITVDRVIEYEGPTLPASILFPTSTGEAIDSHRYWLEPGLLDPETGQLIIAYHSFVVRTRHYTIVVDTCGGNDKHRPQKLRYHMNNWPYLDNLAEVGVKPESVDFVLFTHLHVDHVGWNTRLLNGRWVPTFPRAKYLLGRTEWEYWEAQYKKPEFTDDPYYKDSILPIIEGGQALLVENDHPLDDGLALESSPGHTPGHLYLKIFGGGKEGILCGDVMHHPVQCAEPDWSSCFCVDPERARHTRRAFLQRYEGTDTLIMAAHFPTPTAGKIVRSRSAWQFLFEVPS